MSSNIAISIKNVSKRYEMYSKPSDRLAQFFTFGKRQLFKEFWALKNVTFDVQKGETVGILGRNGSGKSTLLQIIAGTLPATMGNVETSGVLTALLELGSGFNPEFTGRENVYLNGAILGFSREEMDGRFDEIEAFADIGLHIDQPVKTYSSGMAVRLAFAVQACVEPQILIVDEALSVGDEKFQRKCFDYIEKLRSNGCSILLVTHSTATVEKFCQKGVLMHNGEVHGLGEAKEIVDQYHALLYSDEEVYLNYRNSTNGEVEEVDGSVSNDTSISVHHQSDNQHNILKSSVAIIKNWRMQDNAGIARENFRSGETAILTMHVDIMNDVDELQAGILMRTVEGVSAFGTSSLYHQKNICNAVAGATYEFTFEIKLDLCAGVYFITLALANAISHQDMRYLDRRTDVIIIKVSEARTTGSGIALLSTKISSSKISGQK